MQTNTETEINFKNIPYTIINTNIINVLPTTTEISNHKTNEITIESSSEIDKFINTLAQTQFCNTSFILKNQKMGDIFLEINEYEPLINFIKKENHLFCEKIPKGSNTPVGKSDLEISITIEEIFEIYGYKEGEKIDNFSLIGSGLLYFLGEKFIRRFLKSLEVNENCTLLDVIPKEFLEKRLKELGIKPSDFDFRIDIEKSSYLPLDMELDKIVTLLANKMKKNNKCKIWGQNIFKKHTGKLLDINDNQFWFKFIDELAFTKKWPAPLNHHLQYAMVRFESDSGDQIEIVLMKKLPRRSMYTQGAAELDILNKRIYVGKIANVFDYSVQQCLCDEIFKILRKMQYRWKVIHQNSEHYDDKDWEILISKKTKGYRSFELMEEEKFLAVQLANKKETLEEAVISLIDDAIINHQNKNYETYIALLINAYNSFENKINENTIKKIFQIIYEKLKKLKFSPRVNAWKIMLGACSLPEINAYLNLLGFLDLCFVDKNNSNFTTIYHEEKLHLQILMQESFFIPFDLKNALRLIINNHKIIENLNFLNIFTDPLLFDSKNCRLPQINDILSSCEEEIEKLVNLLHPTKQKHTKLLISFLEYLPWSKNTPYKLARTMKTLPSLKNAYELFPLFAPLLKQFPYELNEKQLLCMKNALHKGSEVEKWKNWIFIIDPILSLKEISKECIDFFLSNKELQKGIKIKTGFLDCLVKSWESEDRYEDIIDLLQRPEVKSLYTPWEKLSFYLYAYKIKLGHVKEIVEKCSEEVILKNIHLMKDEEALILKDICFCLIDKSKLEQANTIASLIMLKFPSMWQEIFSYLLKITFNEDNYSKVSFQHFLLMWKKIQIISTEIFFNSGIELLEKIQQHQESDMRLWSNDILEDLKNVEISEEIKTRLSPFIIQSLSHKIAFVNNKDESLFIEINSSPLNPLNKFDLLVLILQRYALLTDKNHFCQLYEIIVKQYDNLSRASITLNELFTLQFPLFTHQQRKKMIPLSSQLSLEGIYNLVRTQVSIENNLSRQEDLILSLEKNDLFFSHTDFWFDIICKCLKPSSSSPGLKSFIKGYFSKILLTLFNKGCYFEAIDFTLSCDACNIHIKLPSETIENIICKILEIKTLNNIHKLDLFSGFLNRHSKSFSTNPWILSLNIFLANYYLKNDLLEQGKIILDRILEDHPNKILNEDNLFSIWSSKINICQNFKLRKEWFLIIKDKEFWLTDIINYCQFVYRHSGYLSYLSTIEDVLKEIKNEKFIDHISETFKLHLETTKTSTIELLNLIQWTEKQSLYHLSIWKPLFASSLVSTNQTLFIKSCQILQSNPSLQEQWLLSIKEQVFDLDLIIENLAQQDEEIFTFLINKIVPEVFAISKYSEKHIFTIFHTLFRLFKNRTLPLSVISFIDHLKIHVDNWMESLISLCVNVSFKNHISTEDTLKIFLFFLDHSFAHTSPHLLELVREPTYNFLIQNAIYLEEWPEALLKIVEHQELENFFKNATYKKNIEIIHVSRQLFIIDQEKNDGIWIKETERIIKKIPSCIKEAEILWISKAVHFFCDTWINHFLTSSSNDFFLMNHFHLINTVASYFENSEICVEIVLLESLISGFIKNQVLEVWLISDFFKLARRMITHIPDKVNQEVYLEKIFISQFTLDSCYLSYLFESGFPYFEIGNCSFKYAVDYFKNKYLIQNEEISFSTEQQHLNEHLSWMTSLYLLEIKTPISIRKAMEIFTEASTGIIKNCDDWDLFFFHLLDYLEMQLDPKMIVKTTIELSVLFEDLIKNLSSSSDQMSDHKSFKKALEVSKRVFNFFLFCNKSAKNIIPKKIHTCLCLRSYQTAIQSAHHIKLWIKDSKTLLEFGHLIKNLLLDFLELALIPSLKNKCTISFSFIHESENLTSNNTMNCEKKSNELPPDTPIINFDIIQFLENLDILHIQKDPMMLPMINSPHIFKDLKILHQDRKVVKKEKKRINGTLSLFKNELQERVNIILCIYKKIIQVAHFLKKIGNNEHLTLENWAQQLKIKSIKMKLLNEMDF